MAYSCTYCLLSFTSTVPRFYHSTTHEGQFTAADYPTDPLFWGYGRNKGIQRKPARSQGSHANFMHPAPEVRWNPTCWRCVSMVLPAVPPILYSNLRRWLKNKNQAVRSPRPLSKWSMIFPSYYRLGFFCLCQEVAWLGGGLECCVAVEIQYHGFARTVDLLLSAFSSKSELGQVSRTSSDCAKIHKTPHFPLLTLELSSVVHSPLN